MNESPSGHDTQTATHRALRQRATAWGRTRAERAKGRFETLRAHVTIVDVGVRVYERDKEAGGTMMGSALALRLFLFFMPFVLVVVGLAGLLGGPTDGTATSRNAGLSGTIRDYVDDAFAQSGRTPWIALVIGLTGMVTTGWSLTRAMVLSSALPWRMGGRQRIPIRALGIVVGFMVSASLSAAIVNRINQATGAAVASVSLIGMAAVYTVFWLLLFQALPRATTDPGASLPGAAFVGVVLALLQAFTQFYLPQRVTNSSQLYGQLGVMIAFLGWFFFVGRAVAFASALNAVIYEQVGSVSTLFFALPVIRQIPRRVPAVSRYFALDHDPDDEPDDEPPPASDHP
jgi:uncharacterized BrkB/YihY/UPF0761 family membrane protein